MWVQFNSVGYFDLDHYLLALHPAEEGWVLGYRFNFFEEKNDYEEDDLDALTNSPQCIV